MARHGSLGPNRMITSPCWITAPAPWSSFLLFPFSRHRSNAPFSLPEQNAPIGHRVQGGLGGRFGGRSTAATTVMRPQDSAMFRKSMPNIPLTPLRLDLTIRNGN